MLGNLLIDTVTAALLVAVWYFWMRRRNHQRSVEITAWVETALAGYGMLSGVRWRGPSQFRLDLRLWNSGFRRAWLTVELEPREMPLNWIMARMRRHAETATFCAELDCPPAMNLHVHNHRWCGRTRRARPASLSSLQFESLGPVMITTREDWQGAPMLDALLAARTTEFPHVSFRRRAPHLVINAPLELFKPGGTHWNLFERIEELASTASARKL
jgi:hypothetical protein